MKRKCFLDDCDNDALLMLHTYPDMTLLCGDHIYLHYDYKEDYDPEDVPCTGEGCEICAEISQMGY